MNNFKKKQMRTQGKELITCKAGTITPILKEKTGLGRLKSSVWVAASVRGWRELRNTRSKRKGCSQHRRPDTGKPEPQEDSLSEGRIAGRSVPRGSPRALPAGASSRGPPCRRLSKTRNFIWFGAGRARTAFSQDISEIEEQLEVPLESPCRIFCRPSPRGCPGGSSCLRELLLERRAPIL